jgi:hypothetical protein
MKSSRVLRWGLCAGVVVAAAFLVSAGNPKPVRPARAALRSHAPVRIRQQREHGNWDSSNWAGYAVTGANGSVTDVTGSWTVPAVTCSAAPTGYSAFWVGIDGFTSSTVEQIGTDSDCVSLNGRQTDTPTYYAWYEFYPQGSYVVEFPHAVKPGDFITASVKYIGQTSNPRHGGAADQFTATITDVTQLNETFSVTASVTGAGMSSAEWIAEAPCCGKGNVVLPLSDFGFVNYSSAGATVSSQTAPIGASTTNLQNITMVGAKSSALIKAQPSSPPQNNGSFGVTWLNAGP